MTKILIIKTDNSEVDPLLLLKSIGAMIEGACNADGSFKQGWHPAGQWYVRKEGTGKYVVVHNQNRIDYGVSAAIIKDIGVADTGNLTDVSFEVTITRNNEPIDLPFRFAMNFIVG